MTYRLVAYRCDEQCTGVSINLQGKNARREIGITSTRSYLNRGGVARSEIHEPGTSCRVLRRTRHRPVYAIDAESLARPLCWVCKHF